MAGKIKHQFHGSLEQIQTSDQTALTVNMIESIEGVIFVLLIFMVFFRFRNLLSVNNYRQTPVIHRPKEKPKQPQQKDKRISIASAKAS